MSRSPSPPVLLRQLPVSLSASGGLVEGSFGDRSKENVGPSVRPMEPKDPSPLEGRSPEKKKTRTSEEGAIGCTPTSGAEGGQGRSDDTPTRMLGTGVRRLVKIAYKKPSDARALPPVGLVPPPPLKERQLLVGRGSERPKSNVS